MDLFNLKRSSSGSSDASRGSGSSASSSASSGSVLSVDCIAGSSRAEEWCADMLQTGDIVEEILISGRAGVEPTSLRAPFRSGRSGVHKALSAAYKKGETAVLVRVRRGRAGEQVELQACVVPHEPVGGGKKQYVLRSLRDPNYAVGFVNRTERLCIELQETKSSRVACALDQTQLQDGFVSYPWEKKMRESLAISNSSCFLSLLVLPKSLDAANTQYCSLEDTLARANAWLNSSQAAGVPIVFMNVQTEALLTKISGDMASSTVNAGSLSELSNVANASIYGFEDYHGVDIGVVKAVRLWFTPIAGEIPLEIKLLEGDTKLGFGVSRTEEGFVYISSVVDEDDMSLPSTRSGLRELYKEASRASKLLVISRIANEKVLPWMVSPAGAIRCYDTVSLSQKLSLHRHAVRPILIHILMWDRIHVAPPQSPPPRVVGIPPSPQYIRDDQPSKNMQYHDEARLVRDNDGEASFRFIDFPISKSWV